ncbi:MAG TPA: hypothetical protein VHV80_03425 [Steroidobacteraceae bacterium]|nr:hypothetical protein [Steroidobacteraceae bacterium]
MTISAVSRREFLRLSAGTFGALGAASPPVTHADETGRVAIVIDPADRRAATPPVAWAVDQLEAALSQHGVALERFRSLAAVPAAVMRCIVAATANTSIAMQTLRQSRIAPPRGPESLALLAASFAGRPGLLACGADTRGLTYALLELADRICCSERSESGLTLDTPVIEQPHHRVRSVGRLFVSDVQDKPWFHDREFWPPYLSMLAAQRFNRFQLSLGIGYDSLQGVRDAYLLFAYPFLLPVRGYSVRAVNLPDDERERNLEMLQFIGRETVKRGMDFQLGLWTHGYQWPDSPDANYTIAGLTPDNHAAYCRDALASLLIACPTITGVTLRTHAESGVREGSYGFWRTVFDGAGRCGRQVELDLHPKGLDWQLIDEALATGLPLRLSPKYWAEHIGMPYQQTAIRELEMPQGHPQAQTFAQLSTGSRSFTRYGYADFLRDDRRYSIMFRVWPGSDRLLLTGDPVTTASHSRALGFGGSDGAEVFEPLSFKGRRGSGIPGGRCAYADPSLEPRRDWEKYLYTYRVWGRLLYDPDTGPEVWRRSLRQQFRARAPHIEAALASSTRILPIVTTAHLPSAANDTYMPEIYTNQAIADGGLPSPYGDTPSPKVFGYVSPLDPQMFSSIEESVGEMLGGKGSGKYAPCEVARWLDALAESSERHLSDALKADASAPDAKLRRVVVDVTIEVGLGRFFAAKLRSGALYSLHRRTASVAALEEALREYERARAVWSQFAQYARGVYVSDITIGPLPHQRGHWLDRLPAMDADIAAMRRQLESARAQPSSGADDRTMIHTLLSAAGGPASSVRHIPPASFMPGQPLRIAIAVDHPSPLVPARLFYRHVNQAEQYESVALTRQGGELRAVIPGAYTASQYALQYFFELCGRDQAQRFPGFLSDLGNQPYFVVQAGHKHRARNAVQSS